MKTSTLLQTCSVLALSYFGSTACVARECTAEEQQEVGATGGDTCETFTPPVQHRGDEEVETLDYTAGTDLRVVGDFRNLEIERGAAGEVEITYQSVVDLAEGRSQAQVDATLAELDISITDGSTITIEADRSGDSNVNAILQVRIPDDFDGNIRIEQGTSKNHGGEIEISSLGSSTNLYINSPSSSTDVVVGNVSLIETAVINVDGLSNVATGDFLSPNLDSVVITTESGDLRTGFGVVPTSDCLVEAQDGGDLEVSLPGGGNYVMQATSPDFSFAGSIPSDCAEAQNSGGGSLTCNEGADTVTFTLKTDGAVEIADFVE